MIGTRRTVAVVAAAAVLGLVAAGLFITPNDRPAERPDRAAALDADGGARALRSLAALPLSFEPNLGQAGPRVDFLARGSDYAFYATPTGAVLRANSNEAGSPTGATGQEAEIRLRAVGGDRVHPTGEGLLPGVVNYLLGSEPAAWLTDIPTYAGVRYGGVYPGIDLNFHGSSGSLEYDFRVAPGADPGRILLAFGGAGGLRLGARGDLIVRTSGGMLRSRPPVVYQLIDGRRQIIPAGYVLTGRHQIGFWLGAYDSSLELVIDPVLVYSSFLGGSGEDEAQGIAVDGSGIYVVGYTYSADFPVASAYQGSLNGPSDAFVTKLAPAGNALLFSTFLGGASDDNARSVALDPAGNAYVTGTTLSSDFPTLNPAQQANGGVGDAWIGKLDASGGLVYSTFLGGRRDDGKPSIAVDASGSAYIAGFAFSRNFPAVNAFQPSLKGGADGFVAKLTPAGNALVFSTYLGGVKSDTARGIAVDASGYIYVGGWTNSTNFPTANPFQATMGGVRDAFITKFAPDGASLVFSTYLGGLREDAPYQGGNSLGIDSAGNVYLAGYTDSSNFPVANAFQATFGGVRDGFVAALSAAGNALIYSTYLGGTQRDEGTCLAVDASGVAYLGGLSFSTNFPISNAFQSANLGGKDGIVARFGADGSLQYSSYLGSGGDDLALGIAADLSGQAYVTGHVGAANFPTANPYDGSFGGGIDAFVTVVSSS
ncbi:MAG: DUF7948 domain-containing protein [Actinomycetota bacterium]